MCSRKILLEHITIKRRLIQQIQQPSEQNGEKSYEVGGQEPNDPHPLILQCTMVGIDADGDELSSFIKAWSFVIRITVVCGVNCIQNEDDIFAARRCSLKCCSRFVSVSCSGTTDSWDVSLSLGQ
jgi:hypothetical protein